MGVHESYGSGHVSDMRRILDDLPGGFDRRMVLEMSPLLHVVLYPELGGQVQ